MKRSSLKLGIEKPFTAIVGALFMVLACISPLSAQENTNSDLNAVFAFKKIFVAPVQDNVEGAYVQPVSEAFARIFGRNPRFELVDQQEQSDTIIQARINKKTSGTDLSIILQLNPSKEIYVTETSSIRNEVAGGELVESLQQLLKAALKRIPFYGTVTGKDGNQVTFDVGTAQGLQAGDIVQITRVDRVKRHPLLKTVVDVDLVPVGSAEITAAEESISFGRVHNVIAGENILKMQKVTAIESRTMKDFPKASKSKVDEDEDRPTLGYIGLGVFLGGFSSSSSGGSSNSSDSSFVPGAQAMGELWITKNWFADLGVIYNFMNYGQSFALNVGYKYLLRKSIFGPQFFAKLGYRSFSWNEPRATSHLPLHKGYSGFNLGLGGSVPVSGQDFGILTSINIIAFDSAVNFFLGGYHFISPKLAMRAGLFFDSYSTADTSQKQVGFLPSILYYF